MSVSVSVFVSHSVSWIMLDSSIVSLIRDTIRNIYSTLLDQA